MMTSFKDEDYNTLVLTFDKNSDIDTFESNIKDTKNIIKDKGLKDLI